MTDQNPKRPAVPPLPAEPIVPAARAQSRQMTLREAVALAEQQQAQGQLAQAESTLRQILSAHARYAPALHLLGVVVHQQGQTELAIELLTQAIEVDPDQPLYHSNRGEMCRIVGRLDEAIASGERAIALDPRAVAALSNVGIAYYDREDFERAEAYQRRALSIDPRFVPALNNMGSIRRKQKNADAAIEYYQKVLAINPAYAEARNNLGAVLTETERYEEAVTMLTDAIRLRPNYPDAHSNLGLAYCGLEQVDRAFEAFSRALTLRPDYVEALMGLARVLQEKSNLPEAEKVAQRALALAPERADVHALLGGLYAEMGFPERATAAYEQSLALDPDLVRAHLGLGTLLMELGQLDRAEACFGRALELDAGGMAARVSLTLVRKTTKDDDNLAALAKEAERIDTLPRPKAMALHFALGKCFDDIGECDRAFTHFAAGCRLKRATLEYDPNAFDRVIDELIAVFDAGAMQRLRGRGEPSDLPVFVLGMARSGTTLTEQIIASHPLVHGAGELPDLLELAHRPRGAATTLPYPQNMRGLTHADLALLGGRYVAGLRKRSATALRITDKMPANFLCIGLVHLMLPNARVVHVRRNPVDTCLSGFTRLFNKGQPHSYDLTELGRYYRGYARLMEHWRRVLPEGAMLEVQYEDLVADNETQARRLIDYCGLAWDDACLEFFKNDRSIRTASVIQVRQPIYRTSLERWKRYEKHLGPLLDALGDLVPKSA
jgi:tetratricopeptide (TPR) repeat protein